MAGQFLKPFNGRDEKAWVVERHHNQEDCCLERICFWRAHGFNRVVHSCSGGSLRLVPRDWLARL